MQAPCYLVAASQAINMALAEAAVCEIFSRAESRWLTRDAQAFTDAAAIFRDKVLQGCLSGTKPNPSKLMACANPAYAKGIQGVLARFCRSCKAIRGRLPSTRFTRHRPFPPSRLTACSSVRRERWTVTFCRGDAVACPKAGQAFLNAELGAIFQSFVDLQVADTNIEAVRPFLSAVPIISSTPSPVPSGGAGGDAPRAVQAA